MLPTPGHAVVALISVLVTLLSSHLWLPFLSYLCVFVVVGVAAFLIKTKAVFVCGASDDVRTWEDERRRGECTHRSNLFSIAPQGRVAQGLNASEEQMDWFEDLVTQICEVKRGIFIGEEVPSTLPSWKRGDFRKKLAKLRERAPVEAGWPDGGRLHEPLDDIALSSRLIAAELNVENALNLVRNYQVFRSTTRGGVLPDPQWLKKGIAFMPCEDRLGRPCLFIRAKYHRSGNIALFRVGLRSTIDAVKAHLLARRTDRFSEDNPLEQYVMLFDFDGAGWSNLDWEAFHCTIQEGSQRYPNMVAQNYLLNVSASVRWIWRTACPLMHPRTRRKCCLVAPRDVRACLQKVIPLERLPPQYGGTSAPWTGPDEARTLEDQIGELLANVYVRAGVVPDGALPTRAQAEASSAPLSRHASSPSGSEDSGDLRDQGKLSLWGRPCGPLA
eukprot:CAMPEP_0203863254 /NCGR_PEP_ID=MMETSP0359-20131031/14059_1 /ASSEMBLY_ACC=CAM_ASM_000338 /TAXON_ID=268821 /ORGANISM="Scrippsiella Hangoei, Strain SHTV-5" /LENGTH=443 /DNA_ID=CAMNT_0050780765 /DNA_START=67 /DNA_END=1395 /DNA_ORIENTATION=+